MEREYNWFIFCVFLLLPRLLHTNADRPALRNTVPRTVEHISSLVKQQSMCSPRQVFTRLTPEVSRIATGNIVRPGRQYHCQVELANMILSDESCFHQRSSERCYCFCPMYSTRRNPHFFMTAGCFSPKFGRNDVYTTKRTTVAR